MNTMRPYRLAFLAVSPTPYNAGLFRSLAAHPDIDLTVYYCADFGAKDYVSSGSGTSVEQTWGVSLLEGYRFGFPRNIGLAQRNHLSKYFNAFAFVHPAIPRDILNRQFDAVIVHGYMQVTHWSAILAARLVHTPTILRCESQLLNPRPPLRAALKSVFLRALLATAGPETW